ncbi:Hypothetical protein R9X50_00536900 [Acrodontium crateriforme]|uniref:DUS-like FMN-binding domain-containing protein n=1 Tax=Acrodontium crateriforme TaxID=150365 RepID=A0AAQ3R924_9PEZI|nr:Hypothetical protein R9X50_00536900 [Acrodontium crateriforme]
MTTTTHKRVPIPKNGVDYRGKIVLAPMVRSGECPSRLLALHYGADLVWGPETIDKSLIGTTRRVNSVTNTIDFTRFSSNGSKNAAIAANQRESLIYRLHPAREGKQLIYQIGTANPTTAVEAAKLIAGDVAGIDVNAGCPKPFSTSGGMGAALLKTPELLCSILRALVAEVGTPFEIGISVKIRLLNDPADTEKLVRSLCETGITGLTIHCRTTPMRPREPAIRAQLRMIANICREAGVACLMNGDVASRADAEALMAEYGVDGAMIATAAETNPSVFRALADGGMAPWEEAVHRYIRTALDVHNRWGNTKYLLGQMIPGKQPAYKTMSRSKSYSELIQSLKNEPAFQRAANCDFSDEMVELARDLDRELEIGAFEVPKMSKAEKKRAAKESAQTESKTLPPAGTKRTADQASLDDHHNATEKRKSDVSVDVASGTVAEQASTITV